MNLKDYLLPRIKKGKFPRDIFEECGFDIDIIGLKRIQSSGSR